MTTAHLFEGIFPHIDPRALGLAPPAHPTRPQLELRDQGTHYELRAELPELEANELRLRVGPGFLDVEGQHHSTWRPAAYFGVCFAQPARRELEFARRFALAGADVTAARARFIDGVLEVKIPKSVGGHQTTYPSARVLQVETARAA